MSSRFGRNQRRRARAVEAELTATQLALGQAVTSLYAVGDPSRGYPSLSSFGNITAYSHQRSVSRRQIERSADVTLSVDGWGKLDALVCGVSPVSWLGILWRITGTTAPYDSEWVGGPPQIDLTLRAMGFNGQPDGVMPMTAARWNQIKHECMA